jgi:uncharacterized protein (TIGR03437 family)
MKSRIGLLLLMPIVCALAQNVGYIVDNALGQVKVIDLNLRKTTAAISTGQQPSEILILPNNRVAFVSNQTDNNVAVLDLNSNTRIATVPTGQAPGSLVSSPDGRFIYVADEGSNDVTVIDAVALIAVATIPVDVTPVALNLSSDGRLLYVVNQDAQPTGTVTIIDTNRNQVTGTLNVGLKPEQFAISPNLTTAYVVNSGSNSVSVVDLGSNQVTGTIAVGQAPSGVAFSTDGSMLYVINAGSNSISAVNTGNGQVTAQIAVGSQPAAMAITFDSQYAYVSNRGANSVSVLSLATNTNEGTIATGNAPFDLEMDPNENYLYVTNLNSQSLTVIDMNTDAVVATIALGGAPVQFAQLNAPTLLEIAPNPAPAGSQIILNGEGFLPTSAVQFTTTNPARTLNAAMTWLDSQGLQVTIPPLPGTSAVVSVNNPDGNSSEQLTMQIGSPAPTLFTGGVINGAGFEASPYPITGNTLVSLFGSFPGMINAQAASLPLPSNVGNAQVTFNGVPAGVIATSAAAGQINVVSPARLLAKTSVRIAVTIQGQTSAAQTVSVAPVAPGIFMFSADHTGAFVHGRRPLNVVSTSDPAQRGEVITMYVTGMGNTNPPPLDGQGAPTDVLSTTTAQPIVTVGGAPAAVAFSGLVPQFSSIYQINFVVPQSAPSSSSVSVVVTTGAYSSNSVKLAVQ